MSEAWIVAPTKASAMEPSRSATAVQSAATSPPGATWKRPVPESVAAEEPDPTLSENGNTNGSASVPVPVASPVPTEPEAVHDLL